jgi:hypothetical protein
MLFHTLPHALGSLCIVVCKELGVTCLYDLENHATAQDVDESHKYALKPEQRSKLKALIGGQLPATGGRAVAPAFVYYSTRE